MFTLKPNKELDIFKNIPVDQHLDITSWAEMQGSLSHKSSTQIYNVIVGNI